MKMLLAAMCGIVIVAVSWLGGYFNGFRDSWEMTYQVTQDPVERGAHAALHLAAIREGRLDDVKMAKEIDIDTGIVWWHDLSTSKLKPFLPILTGVDIVVEREAGIRYLAQYRKTNQSPLFTLPATQVQPDQKGVTPLDGAIARTNARGKSVIESVVSEYGK
jgi:hypothetical protein